MIQQSLDFDGPKATLTPVDAKRLETLHWRVFGLMSDMRWRTYGDIKAVVGGSENGIAARLRDFRKARFGGHTVNRKPLGDGLFAYQLIARVV